MRFMLAAAMALIIGCTLRAAPATATSEPRPPKVTESLRDAVAAGAPGELLPVYLLMRDQFDRSAAPALSPRPPRHARILAMQILAAQSQRPILAHLRRARDAGHSSTHPRSLWLVNLVVADASPQLIAELAARPDVAKIGLDASADPDIVLPRMPERPQAAPGCGVTAVRADQAWQDFGFRGEGVTVAVIDTGCCIDHPDLVNRIWTNPGEIPGNGIDDDGNGYVDDQFGWNFASQDNDLTDIFGHGTQVAGHIAGDGTSGTTTGVAPSAELMILKWATPTSLLPSSVWEAFQYATAHGADVINGSIGFWHNDNDDLPVWRMVVENAIETGVTVCAAAGNSGTCCATAGAINTPGDVPMAITVGATDCADLITVFSSRGPTAWDHTAYGDWPFPPGKKKPTLVAPGLEVPATDDDCDGYTLFSGASASTPHASGAAALLLSADPDLDHHGVKQILLQTATDLGDPGWDLAYGAGRLDAHAAVEAALRQLGTTAAALCASHVIVGTPLAGTPDELAAEEGQHLAVRSGSGASFFDRHTIEIHALAKTTRSDAAELIVTSTSRIDQPAGVGQLLLRNAATGAWETVAGFALGPTDNTWRIDGLNAARYTEPDGSIQLIVKHTVFSPFLAFRFESRLDLLEVRLR